MKKLITVLLAGMLLIASSSNYAGLFGPNNYEECINDGKTGRSNAESAALRQMCRRQFPVLKNLYTKNKST